MVSIKIAIVGKLLLYKGIKTIQLQLQRNNHVWGVTHIIDYFSIKGHRQGDAGSIANIF